jgi:hypothetical protein
LVPKIGVRRRRRHRRRRIAERKSDHPRVRDRHQVICRHAEVMAVAHAGERDAELARARDRLRQRQRARRKREPARRVDEHRAAACADDGAPRRRPHGRCEDASRIADARKAVRGESLRFGVHERVGGRSRHRSLAPRRAQRGVAAIVERRPSIEPASISRCQGKRSRSTLPPVITTPTRLPRTSERALEHRGERNRGRRLDHDLRALPHHAHRRHDGAFAARRDRLEVCAHGAERALGDGAAKPVGDRLRIVHRLDVAARETARSVVGAAGSARRRRCAD